MKYFLIASLLSAAVYAAPAQNGNKQPQQQGQTNNAGSTTQPQGQTTSAGASDVKLSNLANLDKLTPLSAANFANGGDLSMTTPQGLASLTNLQISPCPMPNIVAPGKTPNANDLQNAALAWRADTFTVSGFLDTAQSITDVAQYKKAAFGALRAECDELIWKSVIDAGNGNQPSVQAANATLSTTFPQVVIALYKMAMNGPITVNGTDYVDITRASRCCGVLGAIDGYMASVDPSIMSVRPQACNTGGIPGGVQCPAPDPNSAPITPADVMIAAQNLATGSGNGQVTPGIAGGVAPGQPNGTGGKASTGGASNTQPSQPAAAQVSQPAAAQVSQPAAAQASQSATTQTSQTGKTSGAGKAPPAGGASNNQATTPTTAGGKAPAANDANSKSKNH